MSNIKKVMLTWLITFCKLDNFFLTSQAFYQAVKDRFSTKSESIKSATAFLPMSSTSIRSLAMSGLAGAPKDKKYSSLSSKLELKGLIEPETASSTFPTLHLSRLNISFQCIEELFQYIEL